MLNTDPMITFADGSLLLISTTYSGEGRFTCTLLKATPCRTGNTGVHAVSIPFEAPTCRQAQRQAYDCAVRLYPDRASGMKMPPYLIWSALQPWPQPKPLRRKGPL